MKMLEGWSETKTIVHSGGVVGNDGGGGGGGASSVMAVFKGRQEGRWTWWED